MGRDIQYRPIILFDYSKYDKKLCTPENMSIANAFMMDVVMKTNFVPYHVENFVILTDINDMSVWGIPVKVVFLL